MPDAPPFEIFYASQAQDDIAYWRRTDQQVSRRIERLLADMILHPFTGIGKPEPLWHQHQTLSFTAGFAVAVHCPTLGRCPIVGWE